MPLVPESSHSGGGGGTPAGSDGQIQFNDDGAFGASQHFVWDADSGAGILRLIATADGQAQIVGNAPGVQITVTGADGDAGNPDGGQIVLQAGAGGSDGGGGELALLAGAGEGEGAGGDVTLYSGLATGGDSGQIDIRAGGASVAGGQGGQVVISGGSGTSHGGDLLLQGGSSDGSVQIYSGDSNQAVELNNNGLFLPAAVDLSALPTSNPGPGLLWISVDTLKMGT